MNAPLAVWKVFMRPAEYPHGALARRFVLEEGELRPTEDEARGSHLDIVRAHLQSVIPMPAVVFLPSLADDYLVRAHASLGFDNDNVVELWFENPEDWDDSSCVPAEAAR